LFIELFKTRTHYELNLPAQRLLTDPAAVRSAQFFVKVTPYKKFADERPPPELQERKV
jgi:hypothetical protein